MKISILCVGHMIAATAEGLYGTPSRTWGLHFF